MTSSLSFLAFLAITFIIVNVVQSQTDVVNAYAGYCNFQTADCCTTVIAICKYDITVSNNKRAVTSDWVVQTAAVVQVGAALSSIISIGPITGGTTVADIGCQYEGQEVVICASNLDLGLAEKCGSLDSCVGTCNPLSSPRRHVTVTKLTLSLAVDMTVLALIHVSQVFVMILHLRRNASKDLL